MSYIFAMSDIHGHYEILEETLKLVDLSSDKDNKLILCGDYIDDGIDSCKTLYRIKELTEQYPNQAYALMGNHEQMFLDFLYCSKSDIWTFEWLGADKEFKTVNSFITQDTIYDINSLKARCNEYHNFLMTISNMIKGDITHFHSGLIKWLKNLNYFYETENQIFVHAGVDEEAEEYWMHGTPNEYFISKYPPTFGRFYKDIIAGHTSTSILKEDKSFFDVFWDKESHYFLDGNTKKSGKIPLLKYNTDTKKYTSFKQKKTSADTFDWYEYVISEFDN